MSLRYLVNSLIAIEGAGTKLIPRSTTYAYWSFEPVDRIRHRTHRGHRINGNLLAPLCPL
jgi:hypothetical protein